MSLTLRVRHRDGSMTLPDVPQDATVADLQKMVAAGTGLAPERQILKFGVPAVQLSSDLGHAVKLVDVGLCNRDMVFVEERDPSSGVEFSQSAERVRQQAGLAQPKLLGTASAKQAKPKSSATASSERASKAQPSRGSKRRLNSETHDGSDEGIDMPAPVRRTTVGSVMSNDAEIDPRARDILPAFDRAIAAASKHVNASGEDKHQVWALRKARGKVLESIQKGDNMCLSALHSLPGVGHWVVQQVRDCMSAQSEQAAAQRKGSGKKGAPPASPGNFTWWYLGRDGKPVVFRNDAEMSISATGSMFRVMISHITGRTEKAWLPDAKAPPQGQPAP